LLEPLLASSAVTLGPGSANRGGNGCYDGAGGALGGSVGASSARGWLARHQSVVPTATDDAGAANAEEASSGWDSLDLVRHGKTRYDERSPTEARRGHLSWLLMFAVVVRHVVHKYQQHSQLLTKARLWPTPLQGAHNSLGLFAIPGLITIVGWRDMAEPPRTLRALRHKVGMPLAICAVMEYVLPPLLTQSYAALGFDDKAVHVQAMLPYFGSWLLLFLALCRLALAASAALRLPRPALGALAIATHFVCALAPCPWPLKRYGRHFERPRGVLAVVGPVVSAYWPFYAALPLYLPGSYLGPIQEFRRGGRWCVGPLRVGRPAMVRGACALYVVLVCSWALDGFNTEFSAAADRRRYGCEADKYDSRSAEARTMPLGEWLVSEGCAAFSWADIWQDVWHNLLSASVIVALGHLMPSTPSLLSAVGECSLVCLLVHLCLWGILWPSVWQAVEASAALSTCVMPLATLLSASLLIQIATSFAFGLTPPLLGGATPCASWLRLPIIRPPSLAAFLASWVTLLALGLWLAMTPHSAPRAPGPD